MKKRKLLLKNGQAAGDICVLTAAVRDLHIAYPGKFITDVDTSCMAIWENNPYITKLPKDDKNVEIINCEYPLIHKSNDVPYHFLHGFTQFISEKIGLPIPMTQFKGDIYISDEEKSWLSQIEEMGVDKNFWIINSGFKFDFTAKAPNPQYMQEVVDYFQNKILFVQIGESHHYHPPLKNVINLIGKTDLRQLIRLIYHSSGVLCPVTFVMHAAAAVPSKDPNIINRPCVVIGGGREPSHWEAYPHHRYLHRNGTMDCCKNGGCWKSRCQLVGDGDIKDTNDLCTYPIQITPELRIAKCINDIKPKEIIEAIESYYNHGLLRYNNAEESIN